MSDLRDQLLKAGLVSAEQAKKSEAKEREDRRQKGHRGEQRERQERRDAAQDKAADKAAVDRQRSAQAQAPKLDAEAAARAKQVAQSGKLEGRHRGPRRWYYNSRRGVVPFLELSDEAAAMLDSGAAAIAEAPGGEAWLVTAECAQKLREVGGDWLRLWNRGAGPAPAAR